MTESEDIMGKIQISMDGILKQTELIQFDSDAIYIGRGDEQRSIKLEDINILERTSTMLNNKYFWHLVFTENGSRRSIEFRPNNTLWNRNFPKFHALLTKVNPNAVKTPYRWWFF